MASVEVSLTVGRLDASLALLTTKNHHVIEFPTMLLPDNIKAGSIVKIQVSEDKELEQEELNEFQSLQDEILEKYGSRRPQAPVLKIVNVTQTSCVVGWDQIELGSAQLKSLVLFKDDVRSLMIPNPFKTTATKISGLSVDSEYSFQLKLCTTSGDLWSEKVTLHTHKMTDMSGITACLGLLDGVEGVTKQQVEYSLKEIGAKPLQSHVTIDTTHFISNEKESDDAEFHKAQQSNIPIVRPEWVRACELERRIVGVRGFYLDADPKSLASYKFTKLPQQNARASGPIPTELSSQELPATPSDAEAASTSEQTAHDNGEELAQPASKEDAVSPTTAENADVPVSEGDDVLSDAPVDQEVVPSTAEVEEDTQFVDEPAISPAVKEEVTSLAAEEEVVPPVSQEVASPASENETVPAEIETISKEGAEEVTETTASEQVSVPLVDTDKISSSDATSQTSAKVTAPSAELASTDSFEKGTGTQLNDIGPEPLASDETEPVLKNTDAMRSVSASIESVDVQDAPQTAEDEPQSQVVEETEPGLSESDKPSENAGAEEVGREEVTKSNESASAETETEPSPKIEESPEDSTAAIIPQEPQGEQEAPVSTQKAENGLSEETDGTGLNDAEVTEESPNSDDEEEEETAGEASVINESPAVQAQPNGTQSSSKKKKNKKNKKKNKK